MRRFCWAENCGYRRRAPLNPSSTSNPSKLIQPNAPAPAFNGALADEVGADAVRSGGSALQCHFTRRNRRTADKIDVPSRSARASGGRDELSADRAAHASIQDQAGGACGHVWGRCGGPEVSRPVRCHCVTAGFPSVIVAAFVAPFVISTVTVALVAPTAVLPNITVFGEAVGVGNGAFGGGGGGTGAARMCAATSPS